MGNSLPTADRLTRISFETEIFTEDNLRKNPLKVPALRMIHLLEFPCESQLCTWMDLSFVCYYFFFFFWPEHLLLMELTQLSAGSMEAHVPLLI